MKLSINEIRMTPPKFGEGFCAYGKLSEKIVEWCNHWDFKTEASGPFTNILIPDNFDITQCFEAYENTFEYVDGFSPNLNKHLHIGHLSNLIIAKALQGFGVGKEFIAILGDTVEGDVDKVDALKAFNDICKDFNYKISKVFTASMMENPDVDKMLFDGEGDYKGTKVFHIGDNKIVGRKADGSTTYFYQDVALTEALNKQPTLYLTGSEQNGHFALLNELGSQTTHIGQGLVTIQDNNSKLFKTKKMGTRFGNVIYAQDMIDFMLDEFDGSIEVAYNVLAGMILKSAPKTEKKIRKKDLKDPKSSPGLYLSYTMARLKSAGVPSIDTDKFSYPKLQFQFLSAQSKLSPNILLNGLSELCKKINGLYLNHYISDNEENKKMFAVHLSDLSLGMKLLGMFEVTKV